MEEKTRQEALRELEEVKKARCLAMEALDINIRDEVLKVIMNQQRQYMRPPL